MVKGSCFNWNYVLQYFVSKEVTKGEAEESILLETIALMDDLGRNVRVI